MSRQISLEEVKKHADEKSSWIIIHHDVYDVTGFLEEHPGGADSLLEYAGQDGTQAFEDVAHSEDARELMKQYKIGTIPENKRKDDSPRKGKCGQSLPGTHSKHCGSCGRGAGPCGHCDARSPEPQAEAHVKAIIVPKERRHGHPPPPPPREEGSSKLPWVLVALAGAIIIGLALKKFSSK